MEMHQLKYFVAVARERHFQKAADQVHISQPTLSQQIQKLEKELGTPLLERSSRQVRLTAEGERFLPYANQILDTAERAAAEIKGQTGELAGRLRIGAIPTIGPYILPRLLQRMRKEAPKGVLELFDLTTSVLITHLKEGKVDLGVAALPIADARLATRAIGEEAFLAAVPLKHPLSHKKRIPIKELDQERLLILQEGHCFREQSLDYCRRASVHPQIIFQGSSLTSVLRLVAAGEGVTFVPQMAAQERENPGVRFIPFAPPVPKRTLGALWRMTTPLNRSQTYFVNLVEEMVRPSTRR
jgi:LysR family hydrogen peroxide-inducible transcriptional activator